MRKIFTAPLLGLIYLYKYLISPLLPGGCRHYPTCSSYAIDALNRYGVFKGSLMAASRLGRCHPWGTHGYDPVPGFIFNKLNVKKYSGDHHSTTHPKCDRLKPPES